MVLRTFKPGDPFLNGMTMAVGQVYDEPVRAIMSLASGTVTIQLEKDTGTRAIYMLAGVVYNLRVTAITNSAVTIVGFW